MLLVALAALALAARSTLAATHKISVGAYANGTQANVFDPATVKAAVGDMLEFSFAAGEHNAQVRLLSLKAKLSRQGSTFAKPCSSPASFDTGVMAATAGQPHRMSVRVNATSPLWIVCKPHCELGMAMVVNAPVTGDSLASFVASARGAKLAGPASATGYGSPAPPSSSAPPAPTPKPAASAASTLDSAIDYSLLVCLAFALGSLVL